MRLKGLVVKNSDTFPHDVLCEGLSDTCRGGVWATGGDRQVSDKPQGRKARSGSGVVVTRRRSMGIVSRRQAPNVAAKVPRDKSYRCGEHGREAFRVRSVRCVAVDEAERRRWLAWRSSGCMAARDAAVDGWGCVDCSGHAAALLLGGARGGAPGWKHSMTIMRPPQRGQAVAGSGGASPSR